MLTRALLFLCLAAPLAAEAQNTLTFTSDPSPPYGRTDCNNQSSLSVQLGWSVTPTSGTTTGVNDTYRITATTADTQCPTTTTGTTNLVAARLTSAGNTYTTTLGAILTAAAATTCTGDADVTVYVCVALARDGATTTEAFARNSFKLQFQPPLAPTGLSVTAGNNALNVSWAAPDSTNNPAASTYRVTVSSTDPRDTTLHETVIAGTSVRVDGLVNEVTYTVTVVALSEGGNESPAVTKTGTPLPVDDFYSHYTKEGGVEQGGCAGGAAGLLSLLGLGAVVRAFRRRS
jgi:hypothetical protein